MSNPYSTPLTRALRAYRALTLTYKPQRPRPQPHKEVHRLTADERVRVAERYAAGATVYELAAEYGVSRETVSRHLRATGIAMQRSGHTPVVAEVDEMVRLYMAGQSLEAVGRRLSYVARTVERHLEVRGVSRRDTHGCARVSPAAKPQDTLGRA